MALYLRPRRNDEADRAVWPDLSGNGHDGTLNGFAFTPASGWATTPDRLMHDGGGDYVDLGDKAAFDFMTDFSLELWLTVDAGLSNGYCGICGKYDVSYNRGYDLGISSGHPRMTLRGTSNIDANAGTDLRGRGLSYLILACTPTSITRYLDGAQDGATTIGTWTSVPAAAMLALGRRGSDYTTATLLAGISVFRLHNGALTPAQVAQNFATGPTGTDYVRDGLVLDLNAARGVPVVPKLTYRSGQEAIAWQ